MPGAVNHCATICQESLDTCEGGRFSCYIGPDMIMVPCSFDQKRQYGVKIGNGTSIEAAWNSDQFEAFRLKLSEACPTCSMRSLCMGGCPLMPQIVLCDSIIRKS